MFSKIEELDDLGVFQSYRWPAVLQEFAKRNLIYGWNYSGKTTLSRVFRAIELDAASNLPDGSKFAMRWGEQKFSEYGFGRRHGISIRVFNVDFVESNLLWNGGANPLLILGEESIDLEAGRTKLQERLDRVRAVQQACSAKANILGQSRDRDLSEIASEIKNNLSLPVFNRSPHLSDVLAIAFADPESCELSGEKKEELEAVIRADRKEPIGAITVKGAWIDGVISCRPLFSETASRSAIEALRANVAVEQWVRQGLVLNEKDADCKFCGSQISEARWEALRTHFSDSVNQLIDRVEKSQRALPSSFGVDLPAPSEFYEDLRDRYAELALSIREIERRITQRISELNIHLETKKSRIEDSYEIIQRPIDRLMRLIERRAKEINLIVEIHNGRVSKGGSAKTEARDHLVKHLAWRGYASRRIIDKELRCAFYERSAEKRAGLASAIIKEIRKFDVRISAASIGVVRVNSYLRSFFGSDRLKVIPVDSKFKLYRESKLATSLSEGEKTAISFAYFMASLEENGIDISKTVIYIDDPISSLDANHVFNTFSIIRAHLKDCLQLFISTHHYEFFRLLKEDSFFKEWKSAKNGERLTSFYRVVRHKDCSVIEDLPSALRKYSSEYHLLFASALSFRNGGAIDAYLMPNVLRRMLEAYTRFRFPDLAEKLDQRIARLFLSGVDANRVYKLINHLSHSDSFAASMEPPPEEEVRAVLELVMNRLSEFDASHYEGMCKACQSG